MSDLDTLIDAPDLAGYRFKGFLVRLPDCERFVRHWAPEEPLRGYTYTDTARSALISPQRAPMLRLARLCEGVVAEVWTRETQWLVRWGEAFEEIHG